jgi:hypothetical protein
MKIIDTKTHGYLDYLMGALLIASPWLFNFYRGGAETWVPVILGIGTILYSMMTNYELGLMKAMSMRAHLAMDFVGGAILAVSPWVFGFSEFVFWPHLILGVFEIMASLMTDPRVSYNTYNDTANFQKDRN